jgi:hypothetical protein
MSDSSGPGPVTHLIQVQCDAATLSITVSLSHVEINPGDTVVWSFLGIPAGWTPWIEFRHAGDNAFIGPLTGLTQTPGGIWGVCRSDGWEGTEPIPFGYRAMIQKGFADGWETAGSIVWSDPATLDVRPSPIGQEIAYDVSPGAEPNQLDVNPPMRIQNKGDILVWNFDLTDGPELWRPRIKFIGYEGEGTVPNEQLGPFAALTILPGKIRGSGNNGVNGKYHFEVALVSVTTGQIGWQSSGDPVIDNRGGVIISEGPPG